MKRAIALFLLGISSLGWESLAATNDAPDFNEVLELLRGNLSGVTDAELNRAAVEGLLAGFQGRVALLDETNPVVIDAALVSRKLLLDGGVAYVRVGQVAAGLEREISAAVRELGVSSELKGVVLDLRYTTGADYAAVGAAADLFVSKTQPLLDYGQGMISAKSGPEDLNLPLAVLINGDTGGAAEALAGALRTSGTGLLLGSRTAGRGMFMKEFTLKSGKVMGLACGQVVLGNGRALTTDGLMPDMIVSVKAEDERVYFTDAFANPTKTNTPTTAAASTNTVASANKPARKRMSEAELVRQHREGEDDEVLQPAGSEADGRPVLRDLVLARAVDLLKGLAFLKQSAGK